MADRPRIPRAALVAGAALATGGLAFGAAEGAAVAFADTTTTGTVAITTPTTATTPTTPAVPTPQLHVNWDELKNRCTTSTKRRRVTVHHRTEIERKKVRSCTSHPVKTHSTHVHLAWRHHGVAFGHLTLSGQPVADAGITVTTTVAHGATRTTTLTTNAHGRFQYPLSGPDKTVAISYSPAAGTVYTKTGHITQRAYLALKISALKAGKRAHFSGIVFGGHIPQGLYVQFFYLAGRSGWQPFSTIAGVQRHSGHWQASIKIPTADRGYRYKIRALVVHNRRWPFTRTHSRVITRIVR